MKTLRTVNDLRTPNGIARVQVQMIRETVAPYTAETDHDVKWPCCDSPDKCADLFVRLAGEDPGWNWEVESMIVLIMNTRRRVVAWEKLAQGTQDTLLVLQAQVFRLAVVANAQALVVMHNHPSGDPSPSEADMRVTRDLIRAGQLLKVELLDHVIVPSPAFRDPTRKGYASLRELGYFYA